MQKPAGMITVLGLGPGPFHLMTLESWELLSGGVPVFLRTERHPAVEELRLRGLTFQTFDSVYEKGQSFEEVYDHICQKLLAAAKQYGQIVYAVPGSPLVAEKTVQLLQKSSEQSRIQVKIMPAVSFLEVLYVRLGKDPIDGVTITDAGDIALLPAALNTGLVITQIYDRMIASETKLQLMECYPDDYSVVFVQHLGLPDEIIKEIPLYQLDRQEKIDHLTCLYVPPAERRSRPFSLAPLMEVMRQLRSPQGCLWDMEQTHSSLRRYLVEEVYEVLEAIDKSDAAELCEELGDLLLQIVFHARIAEENGFFSMQDVVDTVTEKLIRRHPHVFGEISVATAAEVVMNWDQIKKEEKKDTRKSPLDGVSPGLPSLMKAFKLQIKAAKVGFDWTHIQPVWDKVQEEWQELQEAVESGQEAWVEEELGDLLFACVNLARFLKVEPETALRKSNDKFRQRFVFVEECVKAHGGVWEAFSPEELDKFWVLAKKNQ